MAAAMRVRVVGSSASVPRPGRACSCHLIRARGTNLLLDMGTGALANLRIVMDYPDLDGIVITHMHADHFLDLIPLRVRPYRIKVFTNMLCIKVNKRDWVCSIDPDPTENARVDRTHEPLSDNIETVGWEITLI